MLDYTSLISYPNSQSKHNQFAYCKIMMINTPITPLLKYNFIIFGVSLLYHTCLIS